MESALSIGTPLMWGGFLMFVVAVLAVDLFVFGGSKGEKISTKQALGWSIAWLVLALAFAAALYGYLEVNYGHAIATEKSMAFLTGYVIEKALSVDNIFVFLMIFSYFSVPPAYQRRVLLYGVLGAIVMRAIMIFAGSILITKFHWIIYVFGAFLLFTGIKMMLVTEHNGDLSQNPLLKWMKSHLKITDEYHEEKFMVIKNGVRWFTPLFLVLVMIEFTDLIFAVDSIPAIFAITTDPFIVFTSNIFAIMGLRALYFLLADMNDRFHLLKYGLALVLVFIGIKMLVMGFYKIPTGVSLGVVGLIIVSSVVLSLLKPIESK